MSKKEKTSEKKARHMATFEVEPELHEKAFQRAKEDERTLSAVMRLLLRKYVEGSIRL